MKIGVFSTFMSPLATPRMIRDFGRRAEDMGLDSIWMGEHVALFDKNTFGYPGSKDGRIPVPPGGGMLDITATFGFLAAATTKVRFGTGVALVPQRNPIYTAKEVCTLDWLSDGRFDFGIGVGWNKEEVEGCGYKWEDRGARCDEFLEVMRRLWTEPVVDFKGKWVQFETMKMDPKPIQKPHVPIIVGGAFPYGARRAVRYGDGWIPSAGGPGRGDIADTLPQFRQMAKAAGREPASLPVTLFRVPEDPDRLRQFRDLGVARVVISLPAAKADAIMPILDRWAPLMREFV